MAELVGTSVVHRYVDGPAAGLIAFEHERSAELVPPRELPWCGPEGPVLYVLSRTGYMETKTNPFVPGPVAAEQAHAAGQELGLSRVVVDAPRGLYVHVMTASLSSRITVAIPQPGAAPSSALVFWRKEDPNIVGARWQASPNPDADDYWRLRVMPNVPPATTAYAQLGYGQETDEAITIARLDLPPCCVAIDQDMVVDLRPIPLPKSRPAVLATA